MIKTLGAEYAKRNVTAIASPGIYCDADDDALNDKRVKRFFQKFLRRGSERRRISLQRRSISARTKRLMSPGRQFTSMVEWP